MPASKKIFIGTKVDARSSDNKKAAKAKNATSPPTYREV
jgi:hypothetical protein